MNHKAWIIHQILIYSFVNQGQKQSNTGLFGSLFTDRSHIGQAYLNIIQLKCQYLLRYLISSLILSGNFESLKDLILPVVLQEKSKYSDLYTSFIEALYDRFDFSEALSIAKQLGKAASEDLLLKNHASELQAQAVILVYQVKSRIYRVVNLKEVSEESGIKNEEEARTRIEDALKKEGFHLEQDSDPKTFKVIG